MPRPNPFLLVTMLFWGFNFISLKVLYPAMEPAAILFLRYFIMGTVLVTICLATKQSLNFRVSIVREFYSQGLTRWGST